MGIVSIKQCRDTYIPLFFSLSFIRFLRSRQSYGGHQMNICCAANDCLLRRKQMIRQYKTDEKDLYRR
jgi:hypothetical protein